MMLERLKSHRRRSFSLLSVALSLLGLTACGGQPTSDEDPVVVPATPAIFIADATLNEGGTLQFIGSVTPLAANAVSFDFATVAGSATAGVDFTAALGSISLAPSTGGFTISVQTLEDALDEANETLSVGLSNVTGANLADGTATGTITDNDPTPSLTITSTSLTEGQTATLTLSLSAVSGRKVTVNYATTSGTATSGSDFTARSGTATIVAGETLTQLQFVTIDDTSFEMTEQYTVSLTSPVNVTLANTLGAITLTDNDVMPSLSVYGVSATEGTNANVPISLSAVSGLTTTFTFTTFNGTGVAGTDYTPVNRLVTIPAGLSSATVSVPTIGNVVDEGDRNFLVSLSGPTNAIVGLATATVSIVDNDNPPQISILDTTATEGGTLSFVVSLSNLSAQNVTFNFATANQTALAGTDYSAATGTASIVAGKDRLTITVGTIEDPLDEANETFLLSLSAPTQATLLDGIAVGTITDNDSPPGLFAVDAVVIEGQSLAFAVTLSEVSGQNVTFNFATTPGTALAASDYVTRTGAATLSPGVLGTTIYVGSVQDLLYELTETMTLTLSSVTAANPSDVSAQGSITNDDPAPFIFVSNASVTESGTALIVVSLSSISGAVASFNYATQPGTALGGADYANLSAAQSIAVGKDRITIAIPTYDDALIEGTETFALSLSSVVNAEVAVALGTITITDNENGTQIYISDAPSVTESGQLNFTVSISPISGQDVSFNYATVANTAAAGSDFVVGGGTLTIPAGLAALTIAVLTLDDVLDEATETMSVSLSGAVNGVFVDNLGIGQITDDDAPPAIYIDDAAVTEGTSLNFIVSLSEASGQPITVSYATFDQTANAASDYAALSGTLTLTAGSTQTTLLVATVDDLSFEGSENLGISLATLVNVSAGDVDAIGTIADNDLTPTLSAYAASATEGANLNFIVSLSVPTGAPVTFDLVSTDGTATAPGDYSSILASATIGSGQSQVTISVETVDDMIYEGTETLTLTASNLVGADPGVLSATGTINDNDLPPQLFVGDLSITEGASAEFVISISPISASAASFDYSTLNSSAASPMDYSNRTGSLTIPAGLGAVTLSVATIDDTVAENSETFLLSLSNIVGATAGDSLGEATLIDNDPDPSIYILDVSAAENSVLVFVMTLSSISGKEISFQFATASGTAISGNDFIAVSRGVTITAGLGVATVGVIPIDDLLTETSETFAVSLSGLTNVNAGDLSAVGTITDDDTPPNLFVNAVSASEGQILAFTVTIAYVSGSTVTFNYATSNGTATSGSDYALVSGTATISPGALGVTIPVTSLEDALYEGNETLTLSASGIVNAVGMITSNVGTINDNDAAPDITIDDLSLNEGETFDFSVNLSAESAVATIVEFSTAGGTASSGVDFTAMTGTVTIPAGNTSALVSIATNLDGLSEGDEDFTVILSNPVNGTLVDSVGLGTIFDSDPPPNAYISDITVFEGQVAAVVVSIDAIAGRDITFDFATFDGSALDPDDYFALSGTITVPAGGLTAMISISTLDDPTPESTEDFDIVLSNVVGASLLDNTGLVTLIDDDTTPNMTINDPSFVEGSTFTFTVSISNPRAIPVTVNYATVNGTATAGSDYATTSGTLTITPYTYTTLVKVLTTDDASAEATETFSVSLSSPTNAILTDNLGVGSILDDDSPPLINVLGTTITEAATANFVVSLSYPTALPVTFNFTTLDSTASSPSDFTASSGSRTIGIGADRITISVVTAGDEVNESTEQFLLSISSIVNATPSVTSAATTINDDDLCTRSTLETFRLSGTAASIGYGIHAFGSLTILTTGYGTNSTQFYLTRRSTNGGTSFSTTDNYQLTAGRNAQARALARDSSGVLYSTGYARYRPNASTNHDQSVVRKSTDGGATWSLVDQFFYATNKHAYGNAIEVDSNNKINVVGRAQSATQTTYTWFVRQSLNGGTSWTTLDSYQHTTNQNAYANGVATDPTGNIYVVGFGRDATANRWIVRKYDGSSWATVDNYQFTAGRAAEAKAIAITSTGEIYVAGVANDATASRWIVRKSSNGGSTWSVIDNYQFTTNSAAQANGISLNSLGHVYVVGQGASTSGGTRWVVRRSQNGGSTWDTVETHQTTSGQNAFAYGIANVSNTDFVVVGDGRDANGARWVTRKMVCP